MTGNESYEPEAVKDTKEFQVAKPCPIRQEVQYLFVEIPDQNFPELLVSWSMVKGNKDSGYKFANLVLFLQEFDFCYMYSSSIIIICFIITIIYYF